MSFKEKKIFVIFIHLYKFQHKQNFTKMFTYIGKNLRLWMVMAEVMVKIVVCPKAKLLFFIT